MKKDLKPIENLRIITSCGSPGLHLLAERVQDDRWVVSLSTHIDGSWQLDITEFLVDFLTVVTDLKTAEAQLAYLEQVSTNVSQLMQKRTPSYNARTLREYILAILLLARAYNALSYSSIQVALEFYS